MWRSITNALAGRRETGRPPSGNGASSFHLHWVDVPPAREAAVTVEVVRPPAVDELYFWALQASFEPGGSGAHTGLQWNPRHEGGRAVNWGGYARGGGLLDGTDSPIPSSVSDPNTRTWGWEPGRRYRLRIRPGSTPGWWAADLVEIDSGTEISIRELAGGGDRLERIMVWSEVFARCDDPPVAVRWTEPTVVTTGGDEVAVHRYRVAFQPYERGGCTNTDVVPADGYVDQVTATPRRVPAGAIVPAR